MQVKVPKDELESRLKRFRQIMDSAHAGWDLAIVFSKINLYYFTGTIQDGMLLIPREGEPCFWVRRNFERASDESHFPCIRQMGSYRDARATMAAIPETVYLETEQVPLGLYSRLHKHFPFRNFVAMDQQVLKCRSIKSQYEIHLMERSGNIHWHVLEDLVPGILKEGMSEAEFTSGIYSLMMHEGHHGIVRFGMSEAEIVLGLIGFGESSIYPTYLDSPGGNAGLSPAVPLFGSRLRKLRDGDLVFVDIGCGCTGYHTDKTLTYVFGKELPDSAVAIQRKCEEIEKMTASLLKPGAIPSEIYRTVMETLDPAFLENFMGYGKRKVNFLGHGIGLEIAENPVIAKGFDEPLEEGMAIAIEPKKGIKGIGMVGTENTFIVTPGGGRSITGHMLGLVPVG